MKDKYIAYVGTYTHGSSLGIHIYDMDVAKGRMKERKVVKINNPSYLTKSRSGKYLYSIADKGVEAFKILPDGDLEPLNKASIEGMRGCYLSTDMNDRFLFVSGYHDGKVTVLRLNPDGSVGEILDGIFHTGFGSVAERNFRPHVSCSVLTPDEQYLCAVDLGLDHVKIYEFNHGNGKLRLVDFLRCELESAPRQIMFSKDGKYAYLICELKNYINVYHYNGTGKSPEFTLVQTISTLKRNDDKTSAAAAMEFSPDGNYLFCSNAGDNSVGVFKINHDDGTLTMLNVLPISGEYPKDIDLFPDGKHLISLNHESNTITLFTVHYEEDKGNIVLNGNPIPIDKPNCVVVTKISASSV